MQTEESINIAYRFYTALYDLINKEAVRNVKDFCIKYGIDRPTLVNTEKDPRRKVRIDWLAFIVRDYGVSANWLLTGKGKMYDKESKVFRNTKKISAD